MSESPTPKPPKQGGLSKMVQSVVHKLRGKGKGKGKEKEITETPPTESPPAEAPTKARTGPDLEFVFPLPLEILMTICTFLESPGLAKLALANKNAFKVATVMMYHTITISCPNRAIRLYEVLLEKPYLASYIRVFSVHTPAVDIYQELHAAAIISRYIPGYKPNQSAIALRSMVLTKAIRLHTLDMTISSLSGTGKSEKSRERLAEQFAFLLQGPIELYKLRIRDSNTNRDMEEDWMKILMKILMRHTTLRRITLPYAFPPEIADILKDHLPNIHEVGSTSKELGIEQIVPGRLVPVVRLGCSLDLLIGIIPKLKESKAIITHMEWSPFVDPELSLKLEEGFSAISSNFPYLCKFSTQLKFVRWHEGEIRGVFDIRKWIGALLAPLEYLSELYIDTDGGDGSFELDYIDLARPREAVSWFQDCATLDLLLHGGIYFQRMYSGKLEMRGLPLNFGMPGPGPFRKDIKLPPIDLASMPFEVPPSVIAVLNNPGDRKLMDESVMPLLSLLSRS